jgi:hypothetical protein
MQISDGEMNFRLDNGKVVRLKYVMICLVFFLFNKFCIGQIQDTIVFNTVDSILRFNFRTGKDTNSSIEMYLSEKQVWPSDDDIYAKIYIQCVVEINGNLSNFEILNSVDERYDKASLDLVKSMPAWKPAWKDGKMVRSKVIIPVVWDFFNF